MVKWFAIKHDNTLKEYDSPKKFVRCKFWLRKTESGRTYTTYSYGNTYQIYNYDTLDKQQKNFVIQNGGWKILGFKDQYPKHAYAQGLMATITDSFGVSRHKDMGYGEEDGVLRALDFLDELSKYQDWTHYEQITSFQLTDFYKDLKKDMAALQAKNKSNEVLDSKLKRKLNKLKLSMDFYEHWLK